MRHRHIHVRIALFAAALLAVSAVHADETTIRIEADQVLAHVSRYLTGACIEDVNHEIYGGIYSQMVFGESFQEPPPSRQDVTTHAAATRERRRSAACGGPSRAARPRAGSQSFHEQPFAGTQSQQLSFESGEGEWGVENQGLNRWGMNFVAGKPTKVTCGRAPRSRRPCSRRWKAATARGSTPKHRVGHRSRRLAAARLRADAQRRRHGAGASPSS